MFVFFLKFLTIFIMAVLIGLSVNFIITFISMSVSVKWLFLQSWVPFFYFLNVWYFLLVFGHCECCWKSGFYFFPLKSWILYWLVVKLLAVNKISLLLLVYFFPEAWLLAWVRIDFMLALVSSLWGMVILWSLFSAQGV